MSDNIPFEIQLEIIKRVPDVKSLVRFRSVSKQWKSFIDSPEFVAAYGSRDTNRLLLRYKKTGEVKYVSFVDVENEILTQQDFAPNGPLLMKQFKYSKVIGSSCGLWGFYGYKTESTDTDMIVIWNPSIRKSVGIVVPCELKTTSGKLNHVGFGVCPSTYDPTIVGMSFQKMWQVRILTLSSKTWKMIPSSNLPCESIRLRSSTQVAAGRFICWLAFDKIVANEGIFQFENLILSFDLITHEFRTVNLPDIIANQFSVFCSIFKPRESLVVSAFTNEGNGQVYGAWMMMMEDGGVMKSFTKLFTINTLDSSIRVLLGFRKSGEPIMETVKKDEQFAALEVYKPCSEHIDNLGIYGESSSFFICPYTESLLLIDHSDGCIISNDC